MTLKQPFCLSQKGHQKENVPRTTFSSVWESKTSQALAALQPGLLSRPAAPLPAVEQCDPGQASEAREPDHQLTDEKLHCPWRGCLVDFKSLPCVFPLQYTTAWFPLPFLSEHFVVRTLSRKARGGMQIILHKRHRSCTTSCVLLDKSLNFSVLQLSQQ